MDALHNEHGDSFPAQTAREYPKIKPRAPTITKTRNRRNVFHEKVANTYTYKKDDDTSEEETPESVQDKESD